MIRPGGGRRHRARRRAGGQQRWPGPRSPTQRGLDCVVLPTLRHGHWRTCRDVPERDTALQIRCMNPTRCSGPMFPAGVADNKASVVSSSNHSGALGSPLKARSATSSANWLKSVLPVPPDRDVEAVADEKQGRESRYRIGPDDSAAGRGTFDAEVGIEGAIEDVSRERFDERVRSSEIGRTSASGMLKVTVAASGCPAPARASRRPGGARTGRCVRLMAGCRRRLHRPSGKPLSQTGPRPLPRRQHTAAARASSATPSVFKAYWA